jgi:C4-type Zn-finger protein
MQSGHNSLASYDGTLPPVQGTSHAVAVAAQSFHLGDSARTDDRAAWQAFFAKLEACAALEAPWTLVLQDPLANSFVSSVVDDPRADPRMVIEARAAASEVNGRHTSSRLSHALQEALCTHQGHLS